MDYLDSRWLVFQNSEDERHSSPHESEVWILNLPLISKWQRFSLIVKIFINVKESVFIFQEEKKLTNLQLIWRQAIFLISSMSFYLSSKYCILSYPSHPNFACLFILQFKWQKKKIIIQVTEKAEKKEEIIRKQEINWIVLLMIAVYSWQFHDLCS